MGATAVRVTDPPASTLAVRILQTACKPDVELQELAALGQSDPGFTMRVLSLINSASCGLGRQVTSLPHAMSMLGIRGLRNVALSLSVSDLAVDGPDGDAVLSNCLRRAVAARALSEASRKGNPDDCFTIGLLLDSGSLTHAERDPAAAGKLARQPAEGRPVLERAGGLREHPLLGSEVARTWHMDDAVCEAIAHHHDAEPPAETLALVGWVAERFAAAFEGSDVGASRVRALQAGERLGLDAAATEEVLSSLPGRVSEAAAVFDRDVGPQPDLDELVREANMRLVELNQNYQQLVTKLEELLQERETLTEELRQANQKLEQLATTDELTALPNKRAFRAAFTRDLARSRRMGEQLSLVMFDVDHFKGVNDTHGHGVGDEVLRTIGRVTRDAVREGDLPARYGGEEFVVVLPNTDSAGAQVVAERIRQHIEREQTPLQGGGSLGVTSSFGVATVDARSYSQGQQELMEAADQALYRAKGEGRNCVRIAPALQ